jgi:uncharacterized repeat protein (TIGR02543 family)
MKYITMLLCALLVLAGCSNIMAPPQQQENGLKITVSGDVTDSRTLYPHANFSKYVLSFSGPESHADITLENGENSALVNDLVNGSWIITAKGYVMINGNEYEAAAGSAPVTIGSGPHPVVNISLSARQDGDKGFFSYSVNFPLSRVTNNASLQIYSYYGESEYIYNLFDDPSGSIQLTPGYYLMHIRLYNDYQLAGVTEIVHIYSNMETRADYTFTDADFIENTFALIHYGQPEINLGTGGNAPVLDPLWDNEDWVIDINRINKNEMWPAFKFLNTVNGHYDQTGYGHTQGKVKALWDDGGMYVYAQMDFHDYYENEAAKTAGTATARVTAESPVGTSNTDNSYAHLYDSLEIFTNERLETYTQGSYGIQYRIAPSPASSTITNSRISGIVSSGADQAINIFYDSNKYYSWIRKDGSGKELGYSVIAYIPWMFKGDTNTTQVFKNDGTVKTTGNDEGPTVSAEFQLNVTSTAGDRDAILTWYGVNGQAYTDGVKNYGKVKLVTGDLAARNIVRGAKDTAPLTVSFNTDGGGSISPIMVPYLQSAGSQFPADPFKTGCIFNGWWDESVTPNMRYYADTKIARNLTLTAHWINEADIVFSLRNWITANPEFDSIENSIRAGASNVTPTQPLYMNGTVPISNYAYIDNDSLLLMINGSGQGLRIAVGPPGGLNLDFVNKKYDIFVEGSVYQDGTSTFLMPDLRIETYYYYGSTQIYSCPISHTVGDTFSFGGEIPATDGVIAIRLSAGSAAMNMVFRITDIVIVDKGLI